MAITNSLTLVEIISNGLLPDLKRQVEEAIMKELIEELSKEARPIIKQHLEALTFSGVHSISDMLKLRDEIIVSCKWGDR